MKYRPQVKAQVGRCCAQPLQFDLLEPIPVIQRQFDGLLVDLEVPGRYQTKSTLMSCEVSQI